MEGDCPAPDTDLPDGGKAEAAPTLLDVDGEADVSCLWGEAGTSGPGETRDCLRFILKREALGLDLGVVASG